ncbi:hypothetical protein Vretifemale_8110, partial [Volvox reticuliferus]
LTLRTACWCVPPRRYVGLVSRSGSGALSSLPPSSLRHLPPLPLRPPSDIYVAKIHWTMKRAREAPSEHDEAEDDSTGEEAAAPLVNPTPAAAAAATAASTTPSAKGQSSAAGGDCPHIGLSLRSNFVEAQNLWDAAMADSIARALRELREGPAERRVLAAGDGKNSPPGWGTSWGITTQAVHGGGATTGTRETEPLPLGEAPSARGVRPLVVHVCGKWIALLDILQYLCVHPCLLVRRLGCRKCTSKGTSGWRMFCVGSWFRRPNAPAGGDYLQ